MENNFSFEEIKVSKDKVIKINKLDANWMKLEYKGSVGSQS
jgi:hypothetical protein